MDENFNCSHCPKKAESCCLCTKQREYLCHDHVSEHMKKSSFHQLGPVYMPFFITRANLPQYVERLEAAEKYTNAMERVKAWLSKEQKSASESIVQIYSEKQRELWTAYQALDTSVKAFYNKAISDIEAMKSEINWWQRDQRELSQECLAVIRSGCHYCDDNEILSKPCFDLGPLQLASPQVAGDEHIANILETKGFGCNCEECAATALQMLPDLVWKCESCEYKLNTEPKCRWCDTPKSPQEQQSPAEMSVLAEVEVPEQPANPTYLCPVCNSPFVPRVGCKSCQEREPSLCRECGAAVAEGAPTCLNCNSKRGKNVPSPPPNEAVLAGRWMCWECGFDNDLNATACKECSTSKLFHRFLMKHYMAITADKEHWVCRCKHSNPLMKETCAKCKRRNILVIHGKKGQGNRIGPFTPNLKR